MRLDGQLAKLMVLVDPKLYRKHVRYSAKGEEVLYARIAKSLYGMSKSALWWYKTLRTNLEEFEFKVNPYDPCVGNADVNGSQMTVTWHVDDLKVSHKEGKELKKFGQFLRDKFRDQLTEHTGNIHDYLGIDLDYLKSGQLGVLMIKYLHKLLTGFSEYDTLKVGVKSSARQKLFEVRDEKEAGYLSDEKATKFHHVTAQLLFLCNRA
jgi:hypothetical protein